MDSKFNLKITPPRIIPAKDIIAELRNDSPEAEHALDKDGDTTGEGRWYEAVEELARFSKRYPGYLFTLDQSTDRGEHFRIYAKDGKSEKVEAELKFPDPNL